VNMPPAAQPQGYGQPAPGYGQSAAPQPPAYGQQPAPQAPQQQIDPITGQPLGGGIYGI